MELVINIPENFIDKMNSIKDDRELSRAQLLTVYRGFHAMLQHGTPLPAGHSRLIAEPAEEEISETIGGRNEFADCIREAVKAVFANAPTIVDADTTAVVKIAGAGIGKSKFASIGSNPW